MRAFLVAVVRPAIAAAMMVAVVRMILPQYSTDMSTAQATVWLFAGIGSGAGSYTVFTVLLWLIAGKPDGSERAILDRLHAMLARLVENRRSVVR
jgi:hypothetical protein